MPSQAELLKMRPPVGSESSCVFFFDVSSLLFFVEKSERDRKEKKVETELKKLKKNSTTYLADQREAVDGPPRRDRHRVHKRDERQTPRQSERNHRCRREHRPGDDVDFRNAAPGPQSVDGLVVEGERGGGAVGVGPDVHAADLGMVLVAEGVGVLLLFFITFFFLVFRFSFSARVARRVFLPPRPILNFLPVFFSLCLFSSSHQVVDVSDVDRVLKHVVVLAVHLDRAVDGLPLRVLELGHKGDRRALVLGEVGGACGVFFVW